MKLVAKIVDAPGIPGGSALLLHAEDGTVLPCQTRADLTQSGYGSRSELTVTFAIDGKGVALCGDPNDGAEEPGLHPPGIGSDFPPAT